MNPANTRINLPPPEAYRPRGPKVPRWAWALVVVVALALGAWAGWRAGIAKSAGSPAKPASLPEAGAVGEPRSESSGQREQVTRRIAGAREAVATGDWLAAKRLFEEVRDIDPDNPDALASLPLIDRRLDEARGTVRVDASPTGAVVSWEISNRSQVPPSSREFPLVPTSCASPSRDTTP